MKPTHLLTSALGLSLVFALGCGGGKDHPKTDAGMDSSTQGDTGVPMDGNVPGDDAQVNDSGLDGMVTNINVSGTVVDADGQPVEGADVRTLTASGDLVDQASTDEDGDFTVGAISEEFTYLHVMPTASTMGTVRPLAGVNVDYTIDGNVAVESRAGFEGNLADLNPAVTYDDSKGNLVVAWNLFDAEDSGMTASLSATHDQEFILDHAVTPAPIETNEITPACGVTVNCRPNPQTDEPMFFPNVPVGTTSVTLTTNGHNCMPRAGVPGGQWPIFADTRTLVIVDCAD